MNGKIVWCSALHEMRSHRRLVRTHIFIWIALIICSLYYLVVCGSYMESASVIPMLGIISPRYIMSLLSGSFVALFCIGVLVLAFDLLSRDQTDRIQEVIRSKPVQNIELLTGRLLGVMITMSIPMLCFLIAIVAYGIVADTFSLTFGQPVVLSSVISFVVLDIIPNFAFFGSLVIFLTMLCKSRLVAIFTAAFALIALFLINSRLPLEISGPFQTVTGNVVFASELTPTFLTPTILLNRITLLLASIGFLCWSSSLDKRLNPTRFKELAVGCTSFCLGLLIFGAMIWFQTFELRQIDRWVRVHDEHFMPNTFPDIHKISGRINIDPGRAISIDLTMDVGIDSNPESEFVLFSLNPGYEISQLRIGGVQVTDQQFQQGLLKVPQRYFTPGTNTLEIVAHGRPDKRFAYLDSIDTISEVTGPEIRQLRHLGTENAIFRSNFVVLSPGIKWYPTSGTATNEDAWDLRNKDFFTLDIEVSVPRNWLVAGPAKRETLEGDKHITYVFKQSSPIPEFALVGSTFNSASMKVEGITFEVFFNDAHRSTFEAIGQAEDNIRKRLTRSIEQISSHGMEYTYGSYSLVEVPSTFRVFGGDVSMDTVMCPPAMLMIRESNLPTYPMASKFNKVPTDQSEEDKENWIASQFYGVTRYLESSMFESNLNYFFRNLIVEQTNGVQEGALALNTLLVLLTEALFSSWRADFEFQQALDRDILNLASVEPIQFLISNSQRSMFTEDLQMMRNSQSVRNAPEVWDAVASVGLLDAEQQARSTLNLRALRFRSHRIVQVVRDTIGSEKLAEILIDFTNRYRGKNFQFEEFVTVFSDQGVDLEKIAGDMMAKAELPGFILSDPTIKQLTGSDTPTYESSFVIENDRPVSGPVRLSIEYQNTEGYFGPSSTEYLPPILVEASHATKVTIESSNPIKRIWVNPYLSLNRTRIRIDFPLSDDWQRQAMNTDEDPVIQAIELVEIPQRKNTSITIDDLDPEFSIIARGKKLALSSVFTNFSRRLLGTKNVQLDNGLPVYQVDLQRADFRTGLAEWTRKSDPTAYGIYRRTFVLTSESDNLAFAKFSAPLPNPGRWKLEYYLPDKNLVEEINLGGTMAVSMMFSQSVSTIHLEIHDGSEIVSHALDASNLTKGWHTIGNFDLSNAEVDVLVSNKIDRMFHSVFADAIRWTPVETEE